MNTQNQLFIFIFQGKKYQTKRPYLFLKCLCVKKKSDLFYLRKQVIIVQKTTFEMFDNYIVKKMKVKY